MNRWQTDMVLDVLELHGLLLMAMHCCIEHIETCVSYTAAAGTLYRPCAYM